LTERREAMPFKFGPQHALINRVGRSPTAIGREEIGAMSVCIGCGSQPTSGGCINASCAYSMGGTYVNGVKVATANGRRLVPIEIHVEDWPCSMYGPWVTRCRHDACRPPIASKKPGV
jgi:hypothetical protein